LVEVGPALHEGAAGLGLEFARGAKETPTQVPLLVVCTILGGRSAVTVTPQSPQNIMPPCGRSRENPNVPRGVGSMGTGVEGVEWECPSWLASQILTGEICRSWDSNDAKGAG
jgi:hypothetical protein